jgi:hypothetical protein
MNPSSSSSSGPPIPAALSLPPGTSIASQGDYEPPLSPMQSHPGSPTPGSPELLAQDNRKGSASAGLAVPLNGWALGSVDDDDSHSSLGGEEEKEKKDVKVKEEKVAAGTQDDKVYEYLMPAWRYRIRKFLTRIDSGSRTGYIFPGNCTESCLGQVLRLYLDPWHTHVLHDLLTTILVVRISLARSRVSSSPNPLSPHSTQI